MVEQSLLGFYSPCSSAIRRLPKKSSVSLAMPGNNERKQDKGRKGNICLQARRGCLPPNDYQRAAFDIRFSKRGKDQSRAPERPIFQF
jgi:hypothetical protein